MRFSGKTIVGQRKRQDDIVLWKDIEQHIDTKSKFLFISPNLDIMVYGEILKNSTAIPYIYGKAIYYYNEEKIEKITHGLTLDKIYQKEHLFEITEKDIRLLECINTMNDILKFIHCIYENINEKIEI